MLENCLAVKIIKSN